MDNSKHPRRLSVLAGTLVLVAGERVSYGLEAGWHARETIDGREGDAVRILGMVMYSF